MENSVFNKLNFEIKLFLAFCTILRQRAHRNHPMSVRYRTLNLFFLFSCIGFSIINGACAERKKIEFSEANFPQIESNAINLNTATLNELKKLPGIGESLAREIIEYRDQNGKFRRPEELLMIKGMGEKKFRELRPFIKTE